MRFRIIKAALGHGTAAVLWNSLGTKCLGLPFRNAVNGGPMKRFSLWLFWLAGCLQPAQTTDEKIPE